MEHYIRIKTYKPIVLKFWVESGVNVLCGWIQISMVFVLSSEISSVDLIWYQNRWLKPARTSAV